MEIRSITDVARNLIDAIDQNTIELTDPKRPTETDVFITQRFIADELEELRDWVKNGILEKRKTG